MNGRPRNSCSQGAPRPGSRVVTFGRWLPGPSQRAPPLSLDRILHGPLRLGIVAALATAERRTFTELRDALGATDGNLNASLQKLEQAGYVAGSKKVEGRVAVTEYQLTRAGQKALGVYLEQLERLVAPVRKRLDEVGG